MLIEIMKEKFRVVPGSVVRITKGAGSGKLALVHDADADGLHVTYGKRKTRRHVAHDSYAVNYWEV
jgi:hypothetical protein